MKRSEINTAISTAIELLHDYHWSLPLWSAWRKEDYVAHPDMAARLTRLQMGWDVTDFGSGRFCERGLTLFCVRNGVQSDPTTVPYAEKLLFVDEGQETPFHCHRVKMEDIINRGGGNLMVEFCHADQADTTPIQVSVDGFFHTLAPNEPLRLTPGESVTMTRGLYHRFYGELGHGMVLAGEVSQSNDDKGDNFFLEELGRFSEIEEDEPEIFPLWNEVSSQ